MVLLGRIELPTSALPRMRSTTELQQHTIPCLPGGAGARYWLRALALSSRTPDSAQLLPMREDQPAPTREERLAAKLRENLKRRKAQARAQDRETPAGTSLPKADPSS